MKKLLTIMILYFNLGNAQDCQQDIPRYGEYKELQVLNSSTGKYEKYNKIESANIQVIIVSEQKIIKLTDEINNYNKIFIIKDCLMSEDRLIYDCIDQDNERKCQLTFSSTEKSYNLVVKYEVAPIVYKISRIK